MASVINQIIPVAGFSLIRDQVLVILAEEIGKQKTLATGAYLDAINSFYLADGSLSLYRERFTPYDVQEYNAINAYITSISENEGSNSRQQKGRVTIIIDIQTLSDEGDAQAADYFYRMAGAIRGILMSGQYSTLGFSKPSIVSRRWVSSISPYQPNETDNTSNQFAGQIQLVVEYDESNIEKATQELLGNDSIIVANNGQFSIITDI